QKKKWQKLAHENAKLALKQRIGSRKVFFKRLQSLKEVLGVQELQHIECFDISHSGGEATVASCVVFDENGPNKSLYRQYNIQEGGSDDYKAMREVLIRRYKKAKEENAKLPDLIVIDGGKGQLSTALSALKECQIVDVLVMGVAKGENRKPGLETLFIATSSNGEEVSVVTLAPTSEALHYIQHIRDEAHRFAITRHRTKISKKRVSSPLENIPGIGPKRRQQLLMHFGGKQGLMGASEEAIAAVPGINKKLARLIYQSLHES
ncbi:MAG TPA: helix-hairpin-helix domain-containing protein, partial [Gammaproteobacteria bacterium]|nr:helix-hairpin-helix domain-containing protein [Gammaproteobacteria bacterium]